MFPTPVSGLTQPMSGWNSTPTCWTTPRRGGGGPAAATRWSDLLTVVRVVVGGHVRGEAVTLTPLSPIGLSMALDLDVSLILLHVAHRWFLLTPVLLAALSYLV